MRSRDCGPVAVDTEQWAEHRATIFSLRVPPGFTRTAAQGIDSEVAMFEGPAGDLSYDFGVYSNTLENYDGLTIATSCETRVNGRRVRFVTGRTEKGEHFVGAHWPALRTAPRGVQSLTLTGSSPDSASARLMHGVILSVRIDAEDR